MKKLSYFICLIFISFAVVSCEENAPNNLNIDNLDTIEPEKRLLTPAEQKEKLSNVANDFVAQFNSTHFASLVKLIDECSYKFRDYNWEAYEENLLSVENFIGKLSNIITETQTGNIPVNTDAYIFSIDRISAKYEADERTQSWKVTPIGVTFQDCVRSSASYLALILSIEKMYASVFTGILPVCVSVIMLDNLPIKFSTLNKFSSYASQL